MSLEEIRARIARSPYHAWAGMTLVELEPGRAVMRMDIRPEHMNPQGIVHGGVIAGLLDSVCGISLRTMLPPDRTHRTVQLSVNFLRAGVSGTLTATGRAVQEGNHAGCGEAEIRDDEGRLVARATATFVNLDTASEREGAR